MDCGEGAYHFSAACFEHTPFVGKTPSRMADFEDLLLKVLEQSCGQVHAWCVLPNHYHLLVDTRSLKALGHELGQLHGRTSHAWNGEDGTRGRKVWYGSENRAIRSERHFWATMNYVHHNPVHHGYVKQWGEWPFSSARNFLDEMGKDEAARIWREFPLLDYGKGWDDPGL